MASFADSGLILCEVFESALSEEPQASKDVVNAKTHISVMIFFFFIEVSSLSIWYRFFNRLSI